MDEDWEDSEEEYYDIEKIEDVKLINGEELFLVKWQGYESD